MSYHLGADPGAGSTGPQPPSGPPPSRRYAWTIAAGVLVVAGLAASALASGLRDDDPEAASTGTTRGGKETTTSSTGETTASSIDLDDLGDLTLGDLGVGSDEPPNEPLSGTDWNDQAQAEFHAECLDDGWETVIPGVSIDADQVCTCIWDHVSTSGDATFEEFNEEYSGDEASTDTPGGRAMANAVNTCAAAQIPGLG